MTGDDYGGRLGRALAKLVVAYDAPEMSAAQSAVYVEALADLPIEAIEEGVVRCIRTVKAYGRRVPQPAELREVIEGSAADHAAIAWAGLRTAARVVGAWVSLAVEDAASAEAVLAVVGSWPALCELLRTESEPMLAAKAKEFAAAYRAGARQQAHGWRWLPGLCAIANQGKRSERHLRLVVGVLRTAGHAFTRVVEHDEDLRPSIAAAAVAALPAVSPQLLAPPVDAPPVTAEDFRARLCAALDGRAMR